MSGLDKRVFTVLEDLEIALEELATELSVARNLSSTTSRKVMGETSLELDRLSRRVSKLNFVLEKRYGIDK